MHCKYIHFQINVDETSNDGQDRPKHSGNLCIYNKLATSEEICTFDIHS